MTDITGLPVAALNVWSGVLNAMLLEVLGSLLWLEAMIGAAPAPQDELDESEAVERLYSALENSEISPTAEDICKHIGGCSNKAATRLLRGLEARMARG